ncbi:M56 family metallopeptidase [Candidatus Uabimicrobium amorphum]|uniref:Peptidase M56 domain-containing protein n=1 Tax=Uabimicrobium amorphum TaxID=2596890 RepID=A0A5S9F2P6_UABAM|nr:M56 family metallopeptidase [Candidatus Uabimicrobium amorphum]BBM83826.1 hypothetical protein UABAM_02181 [Candidatus Uabimicrobium amorphum]
MVEIFTNIGHSLLPLTMCLFIVFVVNKYVIANCHHLRFPLAISAMIFCILLPWLLLFIPGFAKSTASSPAEKSRTTIVEPVKNAPSLTESANLKTQKEQQFHFSFVWPWIIISGLMLTHTLLTTLYITYFWCRKQPVATPEQQKYLQQLCKELSIKRRVVLHKSTTSAPGTFGVFKPVVIVPEFLLTNFSQRELRYILLHELVHIHRGDQIFVFLQKLFLSIYFFHPLAWWITQEAAQSMEICCDRQVVLHEQNSIGYTKSFVRFLELKNTFCPSPRFAIGYFAHVKQRVDVLLNNPIPISRKRYIAAILTILLVWCGSLYAWGNGKYPQQKLGHAAMHISSYDTEDPIEVGQTTTYVISLRNEGTANCTDIVLTNNIPQEMEFVKATGPSNFSINNSRIQFNAVDNVAPGKVLNYKITLRARTSGSAKNTALVKFNEFSYTMRNEEGTTVYGE